MIKKKVAILAGSSLMLAPSLTERLLSGGAWAFCGKVVTSVIGLAVNALLTRLLTPEEIGVYFLTFSLVSMAAVLGRMGLSQTVVRLVAESLGTGKPGRARAAVRTVFRFGASGAFVVAGILTLGVGQWLARHVFDSPSMAGVIGLAAAWVVVVTFQDLLAETFRGFYDIRLATVFGGLVSKSLSIVLFILLWIVQGHADLGQVLTFIIAAGAASALVAGFLLRQKVHVLEGDEQLQDREVLAIAWPLLVHNLTYFALAKADIWILGAFRPQEEVAIYGAAARLVALVVIPLLIVNAVVPPLIAEMYAQGKKKELERALRVTATLAGIPAFVVLVGFTLLGGPILGLVFGEYYREGATVLALLSVGQLVNVWAGSCGLTLMMTGHQTAMMRITVFCGITMVALGLVLVGPYGAMGVAVAASAGLILQNIAMWLGVKFTTGMWTHVGVPKPAKSIGITGAGQ